MLVYHYGVVETKRYSYTLKSSICYNHHYEFTFFMIIDNPIKMLIKIIVILRVMFNTARNPVLACLIKVKVHMSNIYDINVDSLRK